MEEEAKTFDKAIVVTGASTGIGRACVAHGVRQGARVFASVRKREDGQSLIDEFGDAVAPLIFDVTEGMAVLPMIARNQTMTTPPATPTRITRVTIEQRPR